MGAGIDVLGTLDRIDPAALDYSEWLECGMALHAEGLPLSAWRDWSRRDAARFREADFERKWAGFDAGGGVTAGTLAELCRRHGGTPARAARGGDSHVFGWDMTSAAVPDGFALADPAYAQPVELPGGGEPPAGQLARYLEALFEPGELVAWAARAYRDGGKWKPSGRSCMERDELLARLSRFGSLDDALSETLNGEAGAWVQFNPVDGKGYGNANVAAYRWTLVESDSMEPERQLGLIRELRLPCGAIVTSGGKSVHAIVHVGARDLAEYKERVELLHRTLARNGFDADGQNRNPSRLSRMPGARRGGSEQRLVDVRCGLPSWDAWVEWARGESDGLPGVVTWADVRDGLPELAPELVEGVLRQGHKMLVAGPSKAGKSWLLVELARAIATGGEWLGKRCRRGHVLYVNLEIDSASFLHRVDAVDAALGRMDADSARRLHVLNLRGRARSISELAPSIVRKVQLLGEPVSAIVIDPLYKVMGGADENAAGDVAQFMNAFDRIAEEVGCSMVYCHHFSKGAQDGKRSLDMASGSGVFGRDPDAALALEPVGEAWDGGWKVTFTLREFAEPAPAYMRFEWPVHLMDDGSLREADMERRERSSRAAARNRANSESFRETVNAAIRKAQRDLSARGERVTIASLLRELPGEMGGREVAEKTLRRWLNPQQSPWCCARYDKARRSVVLAPPDEVLSEGW